MVPPTAGADFTSYASSSYPPPPPHQTNGAVSQPAAGGWATPTGGGNSAGGGSSSSAQDGPSWHNNSGGRSASTGRPPSSPSHATEPNPNLYVHNVPKDATEEELRDLFSTFGVVERIRLKVNQKIGPQALYAFVTYRTTAEAQLALERLNGFDMRARKLRIEFQRSRVDDDRYYGGAQDSPAGDRKKRQGMAMSGGAPRPSYDQGYDQQHRGGGPLYEPEGPSYKRPRYFDAEDRGGTRQRRFLPHQQQQSSNLPHEGAGGGRDVQVLPQPGGGGPRWGNLSDQGQQQQQQLMSRGRITVLLCDILRRCKPHIFEQGDGGRADYTAAVPASAPPTSNPAMQYQSTHQRIPPAALAVAQAPHLPRVMPYAAQQAGAPTSYDPPARGLEQAQQVSTMQQQQPRRGSSVSSTTPYALQNGGHVSAAYNQRYTPENTVAQSSMPYKGSYPDQPQQQPIMGGPPLQPQIQQQAGNADQSVAAARRGSSGAWLASLARNGKRKLLVEVLPVEGPLERFLTPETSLFNISHRSSWEDTARKPQGASCFIRPASMEMVPGERGLTPVTLSPQRQETYRKSFQEHVDYLLQKERAGVVTFADKRQLYIIPPGVQLYDQLRKNAPPPDPMALLGMFTSPDADASVGGGSVGQIDG